jgi:hypothetical protein
MLKNAKNARGYEKRSVKKSQLLVSRIVAEVRRPASIEAARQIASSTPKSHGSFSKYVIASASSAIACA